MKMLAFLLLLCSCGSAHQGAAPSPSGDTIKVKLNEKFEIKLDVNFGTGYSWITADSVFTTYLRPDSTYSIENKDKEGSPATQVFRYMAIAKGQTTIKFIYIRPWRKDDKPEKEKTYQVTIE